MKLTTRERQLLDAAANGLTDRQIGDDLNISIETVSSYWRGIRLKFQASSRTECVARYSQQKSEYLVVKHELESTELLKEIKVRTEAQAQALAQKSVLEAITDASLAYIKGRHNLKECFEGLLQDVLDLTYSEYGFMGEVLYEGGRPYLHEHALTNIAWNDETRALYDLHHAEGLKFKNLNTLFGEVMVTRKVVIANDAPNDERSTGIPAGHPELRSFLGIPVFSGKEMIGMIGLANREGGYSEASVEYLKPLTTCLATFIIGYRLENERASMLQRIADSEALSREIIAVAPTGLLYENAGQKIEVVNQSFLNMFQIDGEPDVLLARPYLEVISELKGQFSDPNAVIDRIKELLETGESAKEDVMDFVDGRKFRREFIVMRSEGIVRGYLWRHRDVTRNAFTRLEDRLEESEPGSHI